MNFIVYFFVALIAAFSVLFGLDWVSAPMSPMPPSKYEIRAAVPPPPAPVVAEAKPETKPDAKPEATPLAKPEAKRAAAPKVVTPSPVAQAPVPLYPADQQPASIVAAEPGVAATSPPAAVNDRYALAQTSTLHFGAAGGDVAATPGSAATMDAGC
jgi:cytoskeletal protein RodZ